MDMLKRRIRQDGLALGTEILKVDSFLNHQIDVQLFEMIGEEFRMRFADVADKIDKIVTVESSGIAVACFVSKHFGYPPVVFAKKEKPSTMTEDNWTSEVMSFTKGTVSSIRVAKKFLNSGENILIIDDFLAHGMAALGLADIIEKAGASVAGVGIVIEKSFQGGSKKLREKGLRIESLAVVDKIDAGKIYFA
jgi:xanthine phosphoribosyltransferase